MKTKKIIITTLLTAIIAVALLTPQTSRAGDKEWATAGKILTGVVAAHVLLNGLPVETHRHSEPVVRSTVIRYESGCDRRSDRRRYRGPSYRHDHWKPYSRGPKWGYDWRYGYPSRHHRSSVDLYVFSDYDGELTRSDKVSCDSRSGQCDEETNISHSEYTIRVQPDQVTIELSDLKRIYQPHVKGHKAYIQERPYVGHPWITKGEHPSIW